MLTVVPAVVSIPLAVNFVQAPLIPHVLADKDVRAE